MNTTLHQLIEDFIDGSLIEKDLESFLKQLENDKDLVKELDIRKEINEVVQDNGYRELKDYLKTQTKAGALKYPFASKQSDLMKTWHLAAASFALILVAGGLWYILSNRAYSTEKLVVKYYKPANPILQLRSADMNSSEDALKEAFDYYKQSDYNNALKYFKSLESQITARFYSGICYIELEDFDKAIKSFEYVINDRDNLFVEQADWYLGLIYMMNNEKYNAIDQFKKIAKSESYYAAQAKDILKYLD